MKTSFAIDMKMPARFTRLSDSLGERGLRQRIDEIGRKVAVSLAGYFTNISRTRHKTARRLGAQPTGILEFHESYPPYSNGGARIDAYRVGDRAVSVRVSGIPFLSRAFGDLHITPKRAHALTIPIHRYAYAKSAKDLKREGWSLFTLGTRGRYGTRRNRGILFGMKGMEGPVPLYRLAKSATVPKDEKLLPSSELMGRWAADAFERSLAS